MPQPIGFVNSPYKQTSEIPKGLGAKHEAEGLLKVLPEFELGLTDIEGFSHLIVIWEFGRSEGFQLLGTPPSDNRPHGVFATRSPRRPNPIGLTVVELLRREGTFLYVRGVDMLDGTPILDIKPYLSNVPPDALRRGWLAEAEARKGTDPPPTKLAGSGSQGTETEAGCCAQLIAAPMPIKRYPSQKAWVCHFEVKAHFGRATEAVACEIRIRQAQVADVSQRAF